MFFILLSSTALAILFPFPKFAQWNETNFRDFADGELDPALYISHRAELEPDSGCIEPALYDDVNRDGYYDLVSVDEYGPRMRIFLGSDSGYYPADSLEYSVGSGGNAIIADLNLDRCPELILSGHRMGNTTIYWGTPHGPSPINRTILVKHNGQNELIYVADLDRDGYLDILTGYAYTFPPGPLTIFWGSATGYSISNSSDIYVGDDLFMNLEVADFNHDGWSDIALAKEVGAAVIYWGPNRTYRVTDLPYESNESHGISVADLDNDGWLDIVLSGHRSIQHSFIYWGTSSGFTTSKRTILEVDSCLGGNAIFDLNQDNLLDIIYFRGLYVNSQPKVYYNTGSYPYFDETHSDWIGPLRFDATGGIVADLNFDSFPDIIVHNRPNCYILWGPDFNKFTELPIEWDHHGNFREPGNVYDRSLTGFYLSSVYDVGAGNRVVSGTCSWVAHESAGSRVELAFRSGSTPTPDSTWTPFSQVASNGGPIPESALGGRYVQYRTMFYYDRLSPYPTLEAVTSNLLLTSDTIIDVGLETVLAPRGTVDSGAVITPTAIVRNYGNQAAIFPVTMFIGTGYSQTIQESLPPGASDTVTFPAWGAQPVGTLPVVCFTSLADDENPANDTAYDTVLVRGPVVHDVGPAAILAPEPVLRKGDTVRPRAIIRNFGTETERYFDVRFRIGNVYDRRVMVQSALAPNGTVELVFPVWVAEPGQFEVSCSTMLVNDNNPANDKLTMTTTVSQQMSLIIEPDQTDRLELGERKSYSFYVLLEGDTGAVVELLPPVLPFGWSSQLYDSAGIQPLSDSDNDRYPDLGFLPSGLARTFTARVEAPAELVGTTGLDTVTAVILGFAATDSLVRDSATLRLVLAPNLEIHNYPNPFSERTTFIVGLPEDGSITLAIYNRAGELICILREAEPVPAGIHLIGWNGENSAGEPVAPGTYNYILDYIHSGRTERIRKKLVRTTGWSK